MFVSEDCSGAASSVRFKGLLSAEVGAPAVTADVAMLKVRVEVDDDQSASELGGGIVRKMRIG